MTTLSSPSPTGRRGRSSSAPGASCSGRRCRRGCRSGSQSAIGEEQASSEILVSLLQLLAIATFAILYTLHAQGVPARACRSSRCR